MHMHAHINTCTYTHTHTHTHTWDTHAHPSVFHLLFLFLSPSSLSPSSLCSLLPLPSRMLLVASSPTRVDSQQRPVQSLTSQTEQVRPTPTAGLASRYVHCVAKEKVKVFCFYIHVHVLKSFFLPLSLSLPPSLSLSPSLLPSLSLPPSLSPSLPPSLRNTQWFWSEECMEDGQPGEGEGVHYLCQDCRG